MCYGVFTAAAHHAALADALATLRASNATPADTAYANDLLASAFRTLSAANTRSEDRLTYLRQFKCKKTLSSEEGGSGGPGGSGGGGGGGGGGATGA
eukprot:jgi/Tetstr1/437554/TSEL_026226.t1